MVRTFKFDDGQAWHVEFTRLIHQDQETIAMGARFWADRAPDQRVMARLPPRSLALSSEDDLAAALRQALRRLSRNADLEL